MLMLQLLQNFQDFGTYKMKLDETGAVSKTANSATNNGKNIVLLADGNILMMPQ